jgi:hypothetical protein
MMLLRSYMRNRGMTNDLQIKVKKYFEYMNAEQLQDNEIGNAMLNQLTGSLKTEVLSEIYGKILSQ